MATATSGQCFFCSTETGLQCQCGAWYCGDQHLRVHRPGQYCLPFRVASSDRVGRYLVASRDIKPLELVLWDTAAATGPCADSVPVCLECGDKVDGSFQCPGCQAWDTLCALMDHNQERFAKDQDTVAMYSLITNFFLDELKLDFVTKEEIEHMIGVLLTNGFENDHEEVPGRSIYPTLSLCSHSCKANLRHAVNPGHQVALQAQVPIPEGAELSIRYTHVLQGHLKRRKQISDAWFFSCTCVRCSDPTELGSFASAVTCPQCKEGRILTVNSLDPKASWKCDKCPKETDPKYVVDLEEKVEAELEEVEAMNVDGYKALLEKYQPFFPPTNYLMVIIKRYIYTVYGNKVGWEMENMTDLQLEDKAKFCRSFIRYLSKIDPGYSQYMGLSTIELCRIQLEIARRKSCAGSIDKETLVREMKENMALQNQAKKWIQVVKIDGLL